jgi:hypothetical protein
MLGVGVESTRYVSKRFSPMAVYKHQQQGYKAYRVSRSVDGEQIQKYFPRTRDGYTKAKAYDGKLAKQQARAAKKFTGGARRWSPK